MLASHRAQQLGDLFGDTVRTVVRRSASVLEPTASFLLEAREPLVANAPADSVAAHSSDMVNRSLSASVMKRFRSSTGKISNQGMAILAERGLAMQFRRSVTYVAGLFCYLCTPVVPATA